MWSVTGWAAAMWARVTVFLALGVGAAWLWLPHGWFVICVGAAALVELWAVRQLAREWAWHARSRWWWNA